MASKTWRAGRNTVEVSLRAQAIEQRVDALKIMAKIAQNPKARDADRLTACQMLLNRAWGTPKEHVEHSGHVEIESAREAFESRMARVAARLGAAGMPEWPEQ